MAFTLAPRMSARLLPICGFPPAWQVYTYLVALLFKVCLFLVVTHLLHAGNLRRYLEAAEDGKLGPQTEA